MARRIFIYVTATMIARQDIALATVIERMRDAGLEVVDYEEETRRIVVRAPRRLVHVLGSFLRSYAANAVIEVKASAPPAKPPEGARRIQAGRRLLFYADCGEGYAVWGEVVGRRSLLKLCRRAGLVDPAQMPASLCVFDYTVLEDAVEAAARCFSRVVGDA